MAFDSSSTASAPVEWAKMFSREYGVQYAEISLRAASPEVKDWMPVTTYRQVYVPHGPNEVCYMGKAYWNELVGALQAKLTARELDAMAGAFKASGTAYLGFAKSLTRAPLGGRTDAELKSLYLAYQALNVRYCAFIWTVFITNDLVAAQARRVIHAHVTGADGAQALYASVFAPQGKAAVWQLVELVNGSPHADDATLHAWHERFQWLPCLDVHNAPWPFDAFVAHAKSLHKPHAPKTLLTREEVVERLGVTDAAEKDMLAAAGQFAYLKDLRDDFRRQAVFHARQSLFAEIARRMGVSLEDFSYLQEKDVVSFLDGARALPNTAERRNGFVLYYSPAGELTVASGSGIPAALERLGLAPVHAGAPADIRGVPASLGVAQGRVAVVKSVADLAKVQKGDVLVAITTHPDFVPAMHKACAIVTDEGGMTSHAAIVSRELGVPCIVGTHSATTHLKDGDIVKVDATNGTVHRLNPP